MALARSRGPRTFLRLLSLAAIAAVAGWIGFYLVFLRGLPDLRGLRDYRPSLTTRVLDRRGQLIGEFFEERRNLTPLAEIPRHVVLAFVASEDDAFFEHEGIDYAAILRASWVNLRAGGQIRQGGSTITQQVAKSLLLTPERHIVRKVKDMLLARRIEQHFTKDEILHLYLNQIYFGHGAYGIGEASRSYFGKIPAELTVSEAALLAGLPKAPSAYSPVVNPESAEVRRQYVLRRMFDEGFINEGDYDAARAEPPPLALAPEANDITAAAYFTEEVRRALFERLGGEQVLGGGLVIETTLDRDLQRAAVAAVRAGLEELDQRQGYRGPVRRVDPASLDAEIEVLAGENRLEGTGSGQSPNLPEGRVLLGVVTKLDPREGFARVALAPGIEGSVQLEDVAWARAPNVSVYPQPVENIGAVFRVGDVVRFQVGPSDAQGASEEPRLLLHQEPEVEGALLALDVETGEILALVGGYDFERSEFDRAVQARRQPGSAFKPIIYAAALAEGYTAVSTLVDRPVVYDDPESGFTWRPENYGRSFLGRLTLRTGLARSVNNATIHLLRDLGVGRAIALARDLGIQGPLERNLSLALGASDVSLLELTRAYAVFPAQGRPLRVRFITRVLDRDGQVLLEDLALGELDAEPEPAEEPDPELFAGDPTDADDEIRVLEPLEAYLATDLLRAVVEDPKGTGRRARSLGHPIGAKTGTTNDQADAWFVGFSAEIATGVWVGFDEARVLGRGETGARAALPIWLDFMHVALEGRPPRDFPVPDGVVFARIDRETGLLAGPGSTDTYFQAFAEGTEPTETSDHSLTASESDRLLRLDAF